MTNILATGSLALDTTRTPFGTAERVLGGAATYFSISASHFADVSLVSAVGEDFPESHWKLLEARADLSGVQKLLGKSMFFDSEFSYDMYSRKALITELNAIGSFVPKVPAHLANPDYLYLGTLTPENQLKVLKEAGNYKFALMDTIEYYIENDSEKLWKVMSEVDGLVLNDIEARMLCKTTSIFECARKIQKQGPGTVVIKKGEHGSILFHDDLVFPLSAYPLETVIDPTGAGDSFAGGFLGHIAREGKISEATLKQAMAYGNIMGSYAIEDFSVNRLVKITEEDINARYSEYKALLEF